MARSGGRSPFQRTTLRAVQQELARGWPVGLTVLTGDDLYHLDQVQRTLLRELVPGEASEFALTVYGEQRVDIPTVVAAARSLGMFASRRVVLVREVQALDGEPDAIETYAANPPPNSHLIVRAPELDRRRKLGQVLAKSGKVLAFPALTAQDADRLATEISKLAVEKGLKLLGSAAALLAEVSAGDFYRVDAELEKIRAWRGAASAEAITEQVVREVAAGSAVLSGWEVAVAIGRRDRSAALLALRHLLAAGDEPLRLIGGVAFRVRGMLQARAMIERGVGAAQAVRASRLWGDATSHVVAGLQRYSLAELLAFPALLLAADRTLKSRAVAPLAVLESMLDRMLLPATPLEARRP